VHGRGEFVFSETYSGCADSGNSANVARTGAVGRDDSLRTVQEITPDGDRVVGGVRWNECVHRSFSQSAQWFVRGPDSVDQFCGLSRRREQFVVAGIAI